MAPMPPEISQPEIYNAIAGQAERYPYSTAPWTWEILRPLLNQYGWLSAGLIAEIGSNDGQLGSLLLQNSQQTAYLGIDSAAAAVASGNERLRREFPSRNAKLAEGTITDLASLPAEIAQASVILANYVGPSVSLKLLLQQIDRLQKPYLIIDRVYTPDQAEGMSLGELLRSFLGLMEYFRRRRTNVPWHVFLREASRAPIYKDANYQQGIPTYRQNAPGNLAEFTAFLQKTFAGRGEILAKFGRETVLIGGNLPR